jgi:hypothetical protein
VTDGLDAVSIQLFNDRMTELKTSFEKQMKKLGEQNFEQQKKLNIFENSLQISDMNIPELMTLVFMKERDPGLDGEMFIWKVCKQNLSTEALEKIAETEFADAISKITEKQIRDAVAKVSHEARFQLNDVKEKMSREMNNLRLMISDKTEENVRLHTAKFAEIDKARKDAYDKSEARFTVAFKKQELKHAEDKRMLEDRIRKEVSQLNVGQAR